MDNNQIYNEVNTEPKSKSLFKIILIVLGIILIIGAIGFGYIYGSRFLNSRKSKLVSIDGLQMVDNNSVEYEIMKNYENINEESKLKQDESIAKEKEKIDKKIESMQKALISKNPKKIASHFVESQQERYKTFFSANKDNLEVFEEIFNNMELTILSDSKDASGDGLYQLAEYTATWNDYTFSIVFIKEDDKWLIMSL